MLLENDLFRQEIPEKGIIDGHVRFVMSRTEPDDVAIVGFCANVTASLLFEKLQAQGTNTLISLDGRADVVARNADDGLNMQWTPRQEEPQRLDDIAERIAKKLRTPSAPQQEEPVEETPQEEDDEAFVKQITRIP